MTDTQLPDLQAAEAFRFPCAQCGSDLRFSPGATQLKCDHCGHEQAIETTVPIAKATRELDYAKALTRQIDSSEYEVTRVVTCPSCGAQTEFSGDTHAAECPFCATPVVTDTGTHRHIKPQALVPFALDDATARKAMTDWLGRLWFAPNGLQDYARKNRAMNGIYVPYWTFDADTKSSYTGQRGTYYYVTRTVTRNGKQVTEQVRNTRWSMAAGRVARFFDDVLVLASHSLPKTYTDGLEPWDLTALAPYQPDYLAGFRAEGYQVALEDGFTQARQIMDAQINTDVRRDIGGDEQRVQAVDTQISAVTFKHILLPVWLAAYKYNGKTYRFVVNGQSGKVQGERPWSAWKIAFAVLVALIIGGAIALVSANS